MLKSGKLLRWTGIALSVLLLGYFAFDRLAPPPQPVLSGSASLSWVAPTENADESPLMDLTGYAIHYSSEEGEFSNTVYIDDPLITSYTFQDLSPGTYYFSISAIEADGDESVLSNVVTKLVP